MEQTIHGTSDQFEKYLLGHLPARAVAVIEEHLLICSACRECLDRMEEFIIAIKKGLSGGVRTQAGSA